MRIPAGRHAACRTRIRSLRVPENKSLRHIDPLCETLKLQISGRCKNAFSSQLFNSPQRQ
ncbi:hypothetical protein PSP31121_03751 [Pandoraea sputorum]|uniref:Uncharacterized protein n=1 Tax=Pandoraea sputorum TaxID=93222 RepID=A0A5E5BBY0_9BURK|nr:hypothetical protein PSP31121_03751 [Pandoraea sputorum]